MVRFEGLPGRLIGESSHAANRVTVLMVIERLLRILVDVTPHDGLAPGRAVVWLDAFSHSGSRR